MNPTLSWVSDVKPVIIREESGDRAEIRDPRLTAVQRQIVQVLAEAVDEGECGAEGCDMGIGYLLHEDDENPSRSGWVWEPVTVVIRGASAVLVCEEHDPANLYYLTEAETGEPT